jgi:predicted anti-sigma-YlaC factor YlaD
MMKKWFGRRRQDHMGMDCEEVGRILQQYLDDETNEQTAGLVSQHLDACRRCGLEASVYRDLKTALANRADPPEESVYRLRDFGHRLVRGEVDSQDPAGRP